MLLRELYDFLEENSYSGDSLEFRESGSARSTYCVEHNNYYTIDYDTKKHAVRIFFSIDQREGSPVDRDFFLDYLYDLIENEGLGDFKCFLVLPSAYTGELCAYLTDELWGRIEPLGGNSFSVNCPRPLTELNKGLGRKLLDWWGEPSDVGTRGDYL